MKTKKDFTKLFRQVFGLKRDQAPQSVIEARVREGASVTGTNMYILILAILIASIGLNMDSTAVVIGAMLISPLMGPIISVGLGIAEQNLMWFRRAAGKFVFQISISIITSTVYFLLSPIESFSSELMARTNPTVWDVLIALFGGFAAIIANTRKNTMITVVPGAAIATALMPSLCTTGYCIATAKWLLAARAFYLFAINATFICMAAIFVLRLEGVSDKDKPESLGKKRVFMAIIVILIILPSAILGRQSIQATNIQENYKNFIRNEFTIENVQVVKSSINTDAKVIKVALMGDSVSNEDENQIRDNLKKYDLEDFELQLNQANYDDYISQEDMANMLESGKEYLGVDNGSFGRNGLKEQLREAKETLEMYSMKELFEKDAVDDLMALYPDITEAGITDMRNSKGDITAAMIIKSNSRLSDKQIKNIEKWISDKFDRKIKVIQGY